MEHVVHVSQVLPHKTTPDHQDESLTKNDVHSPGEMEAGYDYSSPTSNNSDIRLPPLKQDLHPLPIDVRKIANPAPLGLCAFALTCFLTNLINLKVGNVESAGANLSLALIYGGLVQILVGMWYVMRIGIVYGLWEYILRVCCVGILTVPGKWQWVIHSVLRRLLPSVPPGSVLP